MNSRISVALLSAACFHIVYAVNGDENPTVQASENNRLSSMAGPFFDIMTVDGFPTPRDFFNKYVIPSTPLLMKNAAKISPAFTKWTDSYFVNHPDSEKIAIYAEGGKKENRSEPGGFMSFRRFVQNYNTTDMYMVNGPPKHLRSDVIIPTMLQCEPVLENLQDVVTWFSSGGTKSVLHNDNVDNVNCLYRGEKTLVFINPHDDRDMWNRVIDRNGHSSVDVDAVDFTKFPDLSKVRYAKANMNAGDCLYIPNRWYHQVNSFGSNLAINLWWKHESSKFFDLDDQKCGNFAGRNTMADLSWPGMEGEGSDSVSAGGAYSEGVSSELNTDQFLKLFSFDEDGKRSQQQASKNQHEQQGVQPAMEDVAEMDNGSDSGLEEMLLTERLFATISKVKKPLRFPGFKNFIFKSLSQSGNAWSDRCQEILVNYYKTLDLNKDDVLTMDDARLYSALNDQTLDKQYEIEAVFQEELLDALALAEEDSDKELVMKLLKRGDIDEGQVATIFGNEFIQQNDDQTKDEL